MCLYNYERCNSCHVIKEHRKYNVCVLAVDSCWQFFVFFPGW